MASDIGNGPDFSQGPILELGASSDPIQRNIFLYHPGFSPFVLTPCMSFKLRTCVKLSVCVCFVFADESPNNMKVLDDNCHMVISRYNEGVKRVGVAFRCTYLMCGVVCEV